MAEVDLTGVHAKLRRAKGYASELKERIETRFSPDAYRFTFEFNPQARQYASIIHDLPEVDPEWAILVGEILFQLRSSLDHLAWQIVLFDNKTPGEHTYYPIRDSPYDKQGNIGPTQLNPPITSPDILNALEATQPYRTLDPPGSAQIDLARVATHPLHALRVLNNIDKHRLLLVTAAVLNVGEMWWGLPKDLPPPVYNLNPGVLKNDAPVAWFDFGPNEAPPDFDPHPAVQIAIREKEVAFLTLVDLGAFMNSLCDFWVRDWIIDWRFGQIFNGLPPFF